MKKTLIASAAAAAALGLSTSAMAFDINIGGQVKYEAGLMDNDETTAEHSYDGTRLIITGENDLGNGMSTIVRLQGNGDPNDDPNNDDESELGFNFNEEVWVGLKGDFGQLRFGQSDHAWKNASKPFRAFTDTIGDRSSEDTSSRPADWGRADGIHYAGDAGDVYYGVTYGFNGHETNADLYANVGFKMGDLHIVGAFQSIAEGVEEEASTSDVMFGVSYAAGPLTAGLLFQTQEDGDDSKITVPVTFDVSESLFARAAVVSYTDDELDDTLSDVHMGVGHRFSSSADVFLNVWTADDGDKTHIGFGMRHSF